MQFDSLTYPLFLALTLLVYYSLSTWSSRKHLLLLASYVFYGAWNPWFLPLLITTSTLDWWWALKMSRARSTSARKRWLTLIIATNLGILGYFKYSYFLTDNLSLLAAAMGWQWQHRPADIILPIGISFYTFHSLSYCIDIYYQRFAPVTRWRDYALYVSFFPQLVAGPIVRWSQMKEQIETPRRGSFPAATLGIGLLITGLFAKVVLADAIFAPAADSTFSTPPDRAFDAWLGALAFGGQIFCDFAGYSACALGSALLFGFRLPVNFLNPYAALGFSDFWRRWHISLSTWLRDYLYIPLGGNRSGRLLTWRNLMLTMLIGGLWHGAAWTFVVWGGLHGAFLIAERWIRSAWGERRLNQAGRLGVRLLTFIAVSYTWVWFRAPDLAFAWEMTLAMIPSFSALSLPSPSAEQWLALGCGALLLMYQWGMKDRTEADLLTRMPAPLAGGLLGLLMAAIIMSPGDSHAFIYFQF